MLYHLNHAPKPLVGVEIGLDNFVQAGLELEILLPLLPK
jgi:hypothetical protein